MPNQKSNQENKKPTYKKKKTADQENTKLDLNQNSNYWQASETFLFGKRSITEQVLNQNQSNHQDCELQHTDTLDTDYSKESFQQDQLLQMTDQQNLNSQDSQSDKTYQQIQTNYVQETTSQHQPILDSHDHIDYDRKKSQNLFDSEDYYYIIKDEREVRELSAQIMEKHPAPILGVDCEGLAKGRPLSLLQMYFDNKCYIFDLLKLNPFDYGLEEVMNSNNIMKIFHDFCEDQSALLNQYNVVCNFVFDTQIAHRVICQALTNSPKQVNYQDNNISLNTLLQTYLDVTHTKKAEISSLMKQNDEFWEIRPLSVDMIEYASQDVLYLPQVYLKMQKYYLNLKLNHSFYMHGQLYYTLLSVFGKIMIETHKCTKYAFINNHIQKIDELQPGLVIQAFIKNYQKIGVYCSLNIGLSGIILDPQSVMQLQKFFDIGDVIQVQVEGFRNSGHVILRFIGPSNPSYFTPPQLNSICDNKSDQYRYFQQKQIQKKINNQIIQRENNKSLNIKSPEFIPDSSFSSSNGDYQNNSYSEIGLDQEAYLTKSLQQIQISEQPKHHKDKKQKTKDEKKYKKMQYQGVQGDQQQNNIYEQCLIDQQEQLQNLVKQATRASVIQINNNMYNINGQQQINQF